MRDMTVHGRWLYIALQDQVRWHGANSVSPAVWDEMRRIATDLDQSLRVEALHDGGEMVVIELGQQCIEALIYGTLRGRRLVVLQHEAPAVLADIEAKRRSHGWNGGLPALHPDFPYPMPPGRPNPTPVIIPATQE